MRAWVCVPEEEDPIAVFKNAPTHEELEAAVRGWWGEEDRRTFVTGWWAEWKKLTSSTINDREVVWHVWATTDENPKRAAKYASGKLLLVTALGYQEEVPQ